MIGIDTADLWSENVDAFLCIGVFLFFVAFVYPSQSLSIARFLFEVGGAIFEVTCHLAGRAFVWCFKTCVLAAQQERDTHQPQVRTQPAISVKREPAAKSPILFGSIGIEPDNFHCCQCGAKISIAALVDVEKNKCGWTARCDHYTPGGMRCVESFFLFASELPVSLTLRVKKNKVPDSE